jgi:hypothetical protein
MSAPSRVAPAVSAPGENAKRSEFLSEPKERPSAPVERRGEPLPWQSELDVAIADIDSRLSHPRRRATDVQPTLPQLGQPDITSETIDEIAWRVAELLRQEGAAPKGGEAVAAAIAQTVAAPAPVIDNPFPTERDLMPGGIAISLRIRRPFFRWPFRRRRKRAMITFSDYRVT